MQDVKLKYIQKLYDAGIEMNGQIVCCKGVNDGAELKRSIEDLMQYLPYMRSVSVVPAGITKYREGLFPLGLFNKEEAGEIIDLIENYQEKCFTEHGLHFIHASDEWYILAGRELPEESRYDGYIQLENGVGMMRLLMTEFEEALMQLKAREDFALLKESLKRKVTIATGRLMESTIRMLAERLMQDFQGLSVEVVAIRNDFFGETITVSGLITGRDLISQLKEVKQSGVSLGEQVLIPINMLRSGEQIFLDDVTVADAEAELGVSVTAVATPGRDFVEAILNKEYVYARDNGKFVYIRAYDR